ncbi:MAG: CHAT domain-containing protein [Pyrinomonadaceae bacterium]|nr:CHAT domain-containing protein [Pyrinomonadaceae bacterium]
MEKITKKALILFANPKGTQKIKLRKERKIIEETLKKLSDDKNGLEIKYIDGSTIDDLCDELLTGNYHILQISSHGTENGLILERENGKPHVIKPEALAKLLKKFRSLECVIFNACYSIAQGKHTAAYVPYTIAMQEAIADEAARRFSRGFYSAIATGNSYEFAFTHGCDAAGFAEDNQFQAELLTPRPISREANYEKTAPDNNDLPESVPSPTGNTINVNGNRNVVIGGNMRNSRVYTGNSNFASEEEIDE